MRGTLFTLSALAFCLVALSVSADESVDSDQQGGSSPSRKTKAFYSNTDFWNLPEWYNKWKASRMRKEEKSREAQADQQEKVQEEKRQEEQQILNSQINLEHFPWVHDDSNLEHMPVVPIDPMSPDALGGSYLAQPKEKRWAFGPHFDYSHYIPRY